MRRAEAAVKPGNRLWAAGTVYSFLLTLVAYLGIPLADPTWSGVLSPLHALALDGARGLL